MNILFTGGGTAGHVMPNIALINELTGCTVSYVGTNGVEKQIAQKFNVPFYTITAHKLQRKLTLSNLALPVRLLQSVRQAKKVLRNVKPDVVFSKGGYVGLPVVIACHSLKIPAVIHESDMSLGLSNKISSVFADKLLTAFDIGKGQQVGAIVRKQLLNGNKQKGLKTMHFDGNKPVLLVMGGSLGASQLNEEISSCPSLADTFDIFVITGKNKRISCNFVSQAEYVDNIADVYSATDVCVTRGGANSLCELTLCNVPFVVAPLTSCSRGEQVQNAEWFVSRNCGIMLTNLQENVQTLLKYKDDVIASQRNCGLTVGNDKVIDILKSYC